MLKGPLDVPVKEELRRHAERVARIERIKAVATDAKDNDAMDRAGKLIGKENARHDKWMGNTSQPRPPLLRRPRPLAPATKGDVK